MARRVAAAFAAAALALLLAAGGAAAQAAAADADPFDVCPAAKWRVRRAARARQIRWAG
jgi:hypothetical protein